MNRLSISAQLEDVHELILSRAFLYYAGGPDDHALTTHDIHHDKETGAVTLLPGRLATYHEMASLLQRILGAEARTSVYPEHLLLATSGLLLWWRPSAKAQLYYKVKDFPKLDVMSGTWISQPPLVLAATKIGLKVFALAEDKRPTNTTALYQAPYLNVSTEGIVCLGNNKHPSSLSPNTINDWEELFLTTTFTHTNVYNNRSLTEEISLYEFWLERYKNPGDPFPLTSLTKTKLIISNLLSGKSG